MKPKYNKANIELLFFYLLFIFILMFIEARILPLL